MVARRVTIKDIADECNVSIATVSRVLNNVVGSYSDRTEILVKETASRMNYKPNSIAKALITRKTNQIAFLVPDIRYSFYQEFYIGLDCYLKKHNYRIVLCTTQEDADVEKQILSDLVGDSVDGVVISTLNKYEDNKQLHEINKIKFPMVVLERYGDDISNIPNVKIDNERASRLAVKLLVDNKHKNIAFLKGSKNAYNAYLREQGYRKELEAQGISIKEDYIISGDFNYEKSMNETFILLKKHKEITAIIASNDLMAVGACKAARMHKLSVPNDISIVGLGGELLTSLNNPAITNVNFESKILGEKAGEMLLQQLKGEELNQPSYLLKPFLQYRDSVRRI